MELGLIPFDVSTLKQIHPLLNTIHLCEHIVRKLEQFRLVHMYDTDSFPCVQNSCLRPLEQGALD